MALTANILIKRTPVLQTQKKHMRFCSKWIQPSGYDTNIKIYNCIVKDKVPLILKNKNYASWYSCGPTVYDSAHLGHAMCYVKQDVLQRILTHYFKINLVTVMNITDIDDKIIKQSNNLETNYLEVARQFEMEFWNDMYSLGVKKPNVIARVTDFLPEIILFIEQLVNKGNAYQADNGSVYFDLSKYENYGKLHIPRTDLLEASDDGQKRSKGDFVLWKSAKTGEPCWKSKWGNGRPGWHIECSTIASSLLGDSVDFHCGGIDLKFPHHENEDAQSCKYHGKRQWVSYWVHIGHLQFKNTNEKMSKSLGNTITINEMLEKYTADEFRFACLTSHYRNHTDYSEDLLKNSKILLKKIHSFLSMCEAFAKKSIAFETFDRNVVEKMLTCASLEIDSALRDDFNTSRVVNILLDLVNNCNKLFTIKKDFIVDEFENVDVVIALNNFIVNNLEMLGVSMIPSTQNTENFDKLVQILDAVTEFRNDVRNLAFEEKNRNLFALCDQLRNTLKIVGIEIKDHGKLSSWNERKK